MVSTVKSRPNYYDILGVAPGASREAIAQAFARATNVLRPHVFGGTVEICLAFETLRDPVRRKAYDASLGMTPKPVPPPALRPASAHFMARPATPARPPVAPLADTGPAPKPRLKPDVLQEPDPEPRIDRGSSRRPIGHEPLSFEADSSAWKRTGLAVGGLVAAAVLLGAGAGWWSGRDAAEPAQSRRAALNGPPSQKAPPSFAELWTEPASAAEAAPAPARSPVKASSASQRKAERRRMAAAAAPVEPIEAEMAQAETVSADPLAPETAPATAPAAMPLPHRTVASTIHRIGYSCGRVASATPVEGEAPGVFKITCTSGQSYQAKPVNGRYRFRRWGKS